MKYHNELPIRSKIDVAAEIGDILQDFQTGQKTRVEHLIEDLKMRSIYLDESLQEDILAFADS